MVVLSATRYRKSHFPPSNMSSVRRFSPLVSWPIRASTIGARPVFLSFLRFVSFHFVSFHFVVFVRQEQKTKSKRKTKNFASTDTRIIKATRSSHRFLVFLFSFRVRPSFSIFLLPLPLFFFFLSFFITDLLCFPSRFPPFRILYLRMRQATFNNPT